MTVFPLVSRECYIPECEQPSRAARRDGVAPGESLVLHTGVWTAQQGGRPDVTVLPLVSRECYIPECEQPSRAAGPT